MPEPPGPTRKYGDKEIGKILERATELQSAEPASDTTGGLTLSELEEVAAEAGIDVSHVRRAALELDTGAGGRASPWARLLGAEVTITRETVLPAEVPEPRFEDLLAVLQSTVRDHGLASVAGRTLTWQGGSPDSSRRLRIFVSARDGQTIVRVEENLSQLAGGLFGGIGGGVGGGVGLGVGLPLGISLGSVVATVGFPLVWLGGTFWGLRALYRVIVRQRRRFVDELFGQLLDTAERVIAETSSPSG